MRRLQNVKAPKRKQGKVPKRSRYFRIINETNVADTSTIDEEILDNNQNNIDDFDMEEAHIAIPSADERNLAALEKELNKLKPKPEVVHTLLNITYATRTDDIAASKPDERKTLILETYRAFKMFPNEVNYNRTSFF